MQSSVDAMNVRAFPAACCAWEGATPVSVRTAADSQRASADDDRVFECVVMRFPMVKETCYIIKLGCVATFKRGLYKKVPKTP